jgi:ADP-ribosylglycohydrolase
MLTLKDKFRGCIAASWIGSAMGAAVERWSPEKIRNKYGYLDELQPYAHYTDRTKTEWRRPAGTTEDGIERQRLLATAIIEKQDRILARDLVAVWLRDMDLEKSLYKQEDYDRALYELATAGVPAEEGGVAQPGRQHRARAILASPRADQHRRPARRGR